MELQEEKRKGNKRRRQSKSTSSFLPIDLTTEILLRLPAKSVGRFRCVSKLWLSITTDPYFINLFETRSSRRLGPSLLLCFKSKGKLYVYSIPQHTHTLHEDSNKYISTSLPIDMKYSGDDYYSRPTESVHGLIRFNESNKPILWNPSKKQFLTLPKPRKGWNALKVFLGYDPIIRKHKIMCMPYDVFSDECRVLTLGSAQKSWRTIETNHEHRCDFYSDGRCVNGVIYYEASIRQNDGRVAMSFDVQSGKFDMIEFPTDTCLKLINYRGMLACVGKGLWILEDAKKHKWSSKDISPSFSTGRNADLGTSLALIRGFTPAGNTIFVPLLARKSIYVYFCDPVSSKTLRRLELKGVAKGEESVWVHAFPNHIESQISF